MAEYRYSSTTGLSLWISSMKSTSRSSRFVKRPARSPGLSNTGPEVTLIPTPSSLARIWAKVVFPSPGGPWKRVWSKASPRWFAAWTKIFRFSNTWACPVKSSKLMGRSTLSISSYSLEKPPGVGSRFSFMISKDNKTPSRVEQFANNDARGCPGLPVAPTWPIKDCLFQFYLFQILGEQNHLLFILGVKKEGL